MSLNPQDRMLELMAHVKPEMRYNKKVNFVEWQTKARARLGKLLGLPMETVADSKFRIEWTKETEDYNETRFLFESEPNETVDCHLLVPNKVKKSQFPLIICLQGHSKGMHISLGRVKYPGDEKSINGDRDFAIQAISRGQAALAVEQRGFGDRGGTSEGSACTQLAVQAMLLGKTLIGQRVWDISRAIDEIEKHFPMIDMGRIACIGNSGGGTATIYAAAMDRRISAAMPSCSFCGYLPSIGVQHHCLCNYVPGIMQLFDMSDLVGLIAPRPLVVVNGRFDTIFPLVSADEQYRIVEEYYADAGVPEKCEHVIGPEGHRFYASLSWPAFDRVTGWKEVND